MRAISYYRSDEMNWKRSGNLDELTSTPDNVICTVPDAFLLFLSSIL